MPVQQGPCHWKVFRRSCVHSKGVILLIVWTVFQNFSYSSVLHLYFNIVESKMSSSVIDILELQVAVLFIVLFPVIGFVADTWLGRYKVVTASLYTNMLSVVLMAIAYIISTALPTNPTASIVIIVLVNCGYAIVQFARGTFIVTSLPYIIDQLVGASAEELSAGVFWWWWTTNLGLRGGILAYDFYPSFKFWIFPVLVSATIPVVTHLLLKQWLVRVPVLANPIKHIAKVLNYARKNKYPRNRSALTYWEDDYPSRVDLGKDKYGGPFTEEEVEDVKSVIRMLPLLILVSISPLIPIQWDIHYSRSTKLMNIVVHYNCSEILLLAPILIWQLLVYPFVYNYMPSMLKRMGAVLFLLLLAYCACAILELIGHSMDHSVGCIFDNNNNSTSNVLPVSIDWLLVPQILFNLSEIILSMTALEFIVAQAPIQIRAIMIALWYAEGAFSLSAANVLLYAFNFIPSSSFPSCGFYYFMSITIMYIAVFLLFVFLSRRYRLRERNIPVNYHLFAENYYDKYINIARELERQGLGERDILIQ